MTRLRFERHSFKQGIGHISNEWGDNVKNGIKRMRKGLLSIAACMALALLVGVVTVGVNAQNAHKITVSWTAPVTGGAVATYNVKRGTTTGSEVKIATVNAPATSYVDTNGTPGNTYFYVISASNQFGESPNSNEVSAIFLGDKPGVPVGVSVLAE